MKIDCSILFLLEDFIINHFFLKKYYDPEYYTHKKKYTLKEILENIFFILNSGISWNLMPNGSSIYYHYKRFYEHNIFKKIYEKILNKYLKISEKELIITDTTFIYNINGKEGIQRNKFFKNKKCCKISVIADQFGIPLAILIKEGNLSDYKMLFFYEHKKH